MGLRCLIVDDNERFLDAARDLLEGEAVTVVAVASNGADAERQAETLRPDVVLVDVDLGEESGFDVARRLASVDGPDRPRVILISTYAESDFAELVADSPAIGFLSKSDLSRRAIDALLAAASAPPGT